MRFSACQLQKLYVFRLYLHGSGKEIGKFYEQTLDMCALDFLQIPFISVQRTAHDAHFPALSCRRIFLRACNSADSRRTEQHG